MNPDSFDLLYKDAEKALLNRHLTEALSCIQGILADTAAAEQHNELDAIRQDYGMMLHFMQQGASDPEREKIYKALIQRTFTLLEDAAHEHKIRQNNSLFAECYKKSHATDGNTLENIVARIILLTDKLKDDQTLTHPEVKQTSLEEDYQKIYEQLITVFNWIWTEKSMNTGDAGILKDFISNLDIRWQPLVVSAIMLGLFETFDPQKFRIILYFCSSDSAEVRARALIATVWTYIKYEERMKLYPDLCEGLILLAQDSRILDELEILQRQCLLSLETKEAEKKLQNEIFPDLMKNKGYQRHKMGLDELEDELGKALRGEPNLEWEKGNKHLADNMKKIIEMGKEGIDINLGTFSALKGYAFFRHTANWFMPFDKNHPDINRIFANQTSSPLEMLIGTGNFCDSDKYSLCMMLSQIMPAQRDLMMSQFGAQLEGNEDTIKDIATENQSIPNIYRNYMQNLYRFFKLYPQRSQFTDPFKADLLFTSYPILKRIISTPVYLTGMTDFLIKRKCYKDAISYIEEVLQTETATAELLQKMAFCYQRTENPSKAIFYYQQADLLNPDNAWILKQMYLCYSAMDKYEQALNCLEKLGETTANDARLLSETGLCLMQLNRFEEAAKRFYQLEYNGEKVIPSWRAIAWCNFKMNRYEQAEKYYRKLLDHEKATWEDFLNAGHTAWCAGNIREAIGLYRQYIRKYRPEHNESYLQPFDNDRDELIGHGIDELDICLMRDCLISENE